MASGKALFDHIEDSDTDEPDFVAKMKEWLTEEKIRVLPKTHKTHLRLWCRAAKDEWANYIKAIVKSAKEDLTEIIYAVEEDISAIALISTDILKSPVHIGVEWVESLTVIGRTRTKQLEASINEGKEKSAAYIWGEKSE
ncbi:hypothetical protein QQZ08_000989 [Neonectria magnoliae]|uniref:Uncharacterized protein n=1 Tax=Neonectria magnoliae TaxID=2732573 RepID=A0ABR1IGY2_9HYPO